MNEEDTIIKKLNIRKIKQCFNNEKIEDIPTYIRQAIEKSDLKNRINPRERIGLTVGTRGITNIKEIALQIITELKMLNARPFILTAIGSHGGANSEGQKKF